jgi:phosphoribosyl 1,2-cyclic phosphate phosphodiesterase
MQGLLTFLGTGTSMGVPTLGCGCPVCTSSDARDKRLRPSVMLRWQDAGGRERTVVIDTGPDFREQMLLASVRRIDAVVYTHPHADHIHGIDDLRSFVLAQRKLVDIHADRPTLARLREGFSYCFETPPGSSYPPILKAYTIEHDRMVTIEGEGGPLAFEPLPQAHGDIVSLGFRIDALAYCPDVSAFPEATAARLGGLDVLVIDALQYKPHPSHFSLGEALGWIEKLQPKRAVLTHMHVPLDYATVLAETPAHVEPAFDGLAIEIPYESK